MEKYARPPKGLQIS